MPLKPKDSSVKIVFWNVNGLRAVFNKGLSDFIARERPQIFCAQEIKIQESQLIEDHRNLLSDYQAIYSFAEKKGYSGVANYYQPSFFPLASCVKSGIDSPDLDLEGRFLYSSHQHFDLYNVYFPSGTTGEIRQAFKYRFLDEFYNHLKTLPTEKLARTIIVGDFNICHREIDIHHPKQATKLELSGFLPAERAWMDKFMDLGFIDSFRHIHGDVKDSYTWWSFRANARNKNLGWRIDYCFVGKGLESNLSNASIMPEVKGSDHCPISVELRF